MAPKENQEFCQIDDEGQQLLKMAMTELSLSARKYDRILKVSCAVADLSRAERIEPEHISNAIWYRTLDRQFWA